MPNLSPSERAAVARLSALSKGDRLTKADLELLDDLKRGSLVMDKLHDEPRPRLGNGGGSQARSERVGELPIDRVAANGERMQVPIPIRQGHAVGDANRSGAARTRERRA